MQFMFLFKLMIWNYIRHEIGFDALIQKRFYILCYVLFYKYINF